MTTSDALFILRATATSDLYEGMIVRDESETGDDSELAEVRAAARFLDWTIGTDEDGNWVLDERA